MALKENTIEDEKAKVDIYAKRCGRLLGERRAGAVISIA
jgi:hypothetical protein